jgi:hypothetical protein
MFNQERLPNAPNTARSAFASVTGIKIGYDSGADFDASLLNYLSRRAEVFGERRRDFR